MSPLTENAYICNKPERMEYIGEHLLPGLWGRYSLIVSMVFLGVVILVSITGKHNRHTLLAARAAFMLHLFAIASATTVLLLLLSQHRFEYHYVWQFASTDLSQAYLISALWAGKEGSLLVWILCQALLGSIVLLRKDAVPKLFLVIASVQIILNFMLLGIDAGFLSGGRSPFVLLREMPEYMSMPIFKDAAYLEFLTEGNGLNPLLRNPWMAIHPPVLFMGYAACLIPYAYALAGIRNRVSGIPIFWTVSAAAMLGAGLLLGGAWAYEDLTFGGFWSWDPVENASLVPWLLTLASLHLLLSPRYRQMGKILSLFPYILVLFAAWLTRSGVLSNSSAHSFSGGQGVGMLLLLTVVTVIVPLVASIKKQQQDPAENSESGVLSRQFWLFLASAFMIISSLQIITVTSFPAFNQWFGLQLVPPADRVGFYNNWQQWLVMLMALLLGSGIYLKSERINPVQWSKALMPAFLGASALLAVFILMNPLIPWPRYLLMFALMFAGIAVLDEMLRIRRGKTNFAAALAHLGFVVFIAGAVFTFSYKQDLTSGGGHGRQGQQMIKGQIVALEEGHASYAGRQPAGDRILYRLDFLHQGRKGEYYLDYSLWPAVIEEEGMGPVPVPDTRKELHEDIFVYLSHAEITNDEYAQAFRGTAAVGDSMITPLGLIILHSLHHEESKEGDGTIRSEAACSLLQPGGLTRSFKPLFAWKKGNASFSDAIDDSLGLRIRLELPYQDDSASISLHTRRQDMVVMNVSRFPWINILWLGCILMAAGFIWSLVKRALHRNNH
jgi:cytochrome c-type biogenesis protein CcmF